MDPFQTLLLNLSLSSVPKPRNELLSGGGDIRRSFSEECIMSESSWGLCKSCRWWKIEPDAVVQNLTMGVCIDEKLRPFELRVSGISGCDRFEEGKPHRGKGASEIPPDSGAD